MFMNDLILSKKSRTHVIYDSLLCKLRRFVLQKIFPKQPILLPLEKQRNGTMAYLSSGCTLDVESIQCFSFFAAKGYTDFFWDIGANLGLYSLQSQHLFKNFVCVEPNPLIFPILSINFQLAGLQDRSKLFQIALGQETLQTTLFAPAQNSLIADSGCGFISEGNPYFTPPKLQDGIFKKFEVEMIHAGSFFKERWAETSQKKGVIKIDVEGLEMALLKAISRDLIPLCPKENIPIIFFESWEIHPHLGDIRAAFSEYDLFSLTKNTGLPKWKKIFSFIKTGKTVTLKNTTHSAQEEWGDNFVLIPKIGRFQ